jgi:hypothetical protein
MHWKANEWHRGERAAQSSVRCQPEKSFTDGILPWLHFRRRTRMPFRPWPEHAFEGQLLYVLRPGACGGPASGGVCSRTASPLTSLPAAAQARLWALRRKRFSRSATPFRALRLAGGADFPGVFAIGRPTPVAWKQRSQKWSYWFCENSAKSKLLSSHTLASNEGLLRN